MIRKLRHATGSMTCIMLVPLVEHAILSAYLDSQSLYMNPSSPKTIALIDDEPTVVSALKLLLQALGYSAEPFTDPKTAIETLPSLPKIDVLLCDLRMPGMNGIEVLRCTQATHPHIPFVLMSAHATEKDVAEAQKLGAVGYLSKPFTPDQLNKMLSDLADGPSGRFRSW